MKSKKRLQIYLPSHINSNFVLASITWRIPGLLPRSPAKSGFLPRSGRQLFFLHVIPGLSGSVIPYASLIAPQHVIQTFLCSPLLLYLTCFLFQHLQGFRWPLGCYWDNVSLWGVWCVSLVMILSRPSACLLVFLSLPVKTATHQACLSVWMSGKESGKCILLGSPSWKDDLKWISGFVLRLLGYQHPSWQTWLDR